MCAHGPKMVVVIVYPDAIAKFFWNDLIGTACLQNMEKDWSG